MFRAIKSFSFLAIFPTLLIAILVSGCGRNSGKAIQIKGSDTMVNLGQAWSEAFMKVNPDIPIAVTGGGSGTGIAALLSKSTDIAQSSRSIEPKEIEQAKKNGVDPKEFHVANDGITVVVNPSNPVSKLTIQQLSDIFTGKITNWKEVGGPDRKIVALSRERNSGTHVFFLEHVVKLGDKKSKNEFATGVLMMPSSQAIVEEVSSNPSAIGYFGLGYLSAKEKAVAVAKSAGSPAILPSVKTVLNDSYPISRSLLLYTNGAPAGKVKSFIDFVMSKEGQQIVLKMDFVPVK
ncbi:MAG TPA: PstS family phosphate ABC transporter substrate-binding protein [Candidatus Omnitrophota bacterium]|nr:PstS family phosphate ABC transporter substrate-binding protein [Candidatus Omnitrophota bacterium]